MHECIHFIVAPTSSVSWYDDFLALENSYKLWLTTFYILNKGEMLPRIHSLFQDRPQPAIPVAFVLPQEQCIVKFLLVFANSVLLGGYNC